MAYWDPWHGCHRFSDGCRYCYIFQGDKKRGIDTHQITKTAHFDAPIQKKKNGEYKMKGGQLVYLCFSSDFLLEDADEMRQACWQMIKERADLDFLFLTKRIERLSACLPTDWGSGYPNVIVGCTIENQKNADQRLKIFSELPIAHKNIIAQPLLEKINILPYLKDIELVVVGGEYHREARPFDHAWVLDLRTQCQKAHVHFQFRQCGTHYLKDGIMHTLKYRELTSLAKAANLDL